MELTQITTTYNAPRIIRAKALAFYGRLFDFELRGKSATSAFIDLGDQFLALQKGRKQSPDDCRHFGLVVAGVQSVGSSPPEGIVLVFSSLDRALGRPPRRAFRQIGTFATPV